MIMDRVKDNFVRGLNFRLYQTLANSKFADLSEAKAAASRTERDLMARADLYAMSDGSTQPNSRNSGAPRLGIGRARQFSKQEEQRASSSPDYRQSAPGYRRMKPGMHRDPDADVRCYFCNELGHIFAVCRYKGQRRPFESRFSLPSAKLFKGDVGFPLFLFAIHRSHYVCQ